MEPTLRKLAIFIGIGLLLVSIFWSQDGFNFDLAGRSGYGQVATIIGWFLAISVTVVQFVFSTSYKDLNASLKFFGILAYIYSIYTNYWGIMSFQGWVAGDDTFRWGAGMLAFVMDGVPEPLIAWGLYESLSGDFIGNLIKVFNQVPQRNNHQPAQARPQNQVQFQQQSREERHAQMRAPQNPQGRHEPTPEERLQKHFQGNNQMRNRN